MLQCVWPAAAPTADLFTRPYAPFPASQQHRSPIRLPYTDTPSLRPALSPPPHPLQVRTIFPVGANRGAPACTQHAAYAFSLLGPGSHACGRLGRDHRSNYVFFVLDFSCSGFSGGSFCQKCYDPDCRGYRSPWAPLPAEVWQQRRLAETAAAWQQRQQLLLLQHQEGPQQDEEQQRPQDEQQQ